MRWILIVTLATTLGIAGGSFADLEHMKALLSAHGQLDRQNNFQAASNLQTIVNPAKNTKNIPSTVIAQSIQPIHLQVTPDSQEPDLYNGCEVTSLSMLLSAAGHPVDKNDLAYEIKKDSTPATFDPDGNITSWGDPNIGFVGDISGDEPGYGVNHGPIVNLLNLVLPHQAEDMTGTSFDQVLSRVKSGKPVIAWTTDSFQPTDDWISWQGPNGPVHATFDEHVVLIVGYDDQHIFINDPLDGTADKTVDRAQFIESWKQLGQQAVTFKDK